MWLAVKMAPSLSPPQFFNSSKNPYYFFIICGIAVIAFIALLVHAFAGRCCGWFSRVFYGQPHPPPMREVQTWIPAFEFRKEAEETDVECAVCLSAIADAEMVRQLLQCGHTFHVACIDLWFRSQTSCPVCRSTVLPTPSDSMEAQSQQAMLENGILRSSITV